MDLVESQPNDLNIKKKLLPKNFNISDDIRLSLLFQYIFLKKFITINNKKYKCDIYKISNTTKVDTNYYFIIFNEGYGQIKLINNLFCGAITFYDLTVGDIVLEETDYKIKNILSGTNKMVKIDNDVFLDFSFINDEKIIIEFI